MSQYNFLIKSDIPIANKIKHGWEAYRDYNNCLIMKGDKVIKISTRCYDRLYIQGLINHGKD